MKSCIPNVGANMNMLRTTKERCSYCGFPIGAGSYKIGRCSRCGSDLFEDVNENRSTMISSEKYHFRNEKDIGSALLSSKKYHFREYYGKFRVCDNCHEYVPDEEVCPSCGKNQMVVGVFEKYSFSNLRRCGNCSYTSYSLDFLSKM